jgi:hypothetical protein
VASWSLKKKLYKVFCDPAGTSSSCIHHHDHLNAVMISFFSSYKKIMQRQNPHSDLFPYENHPSVLLCIAIFSREEEEEKDPILPRLLLENTQISNCT